MADNKIETVEPDPAATSLTDDATVNGKEEAVSGETDKLGEQAAEAVEAEKESEDGEIMLAYNASFAQLNHTHSEG